MVYFVRVCSFRIRLNNYPPAVTIIFINLMPSQLVFKHMLT